MLLPWSCWDRWRIPDSSHLHRYSCSIFNECLSCGGAQGCWCNINYISTHWENPSTLLSRNTTFSDINSIDWECSLAAFSPGSRRTCPRPAGTSDHKQQQNNCNSLSRFRLHQLCSAVFFHNCQIAITIFIIINFGDPRYHKHESSCSFIWQPQTRTCGHPARFWAIQFASRSFDTGAFRRRYWPEVSVSCHFPRWKVSQPWNLFWSQRCVLISL